MRSRADGRGDLCGDESQSTSDPRGEGESSSSMLSSIVSGFNPVSGAPGSCSADPGMSTFVLPATAALFPAALVAIPTAALVAVPAAALVSAALLVAVPAALFYVIPTLFYVIPTLFYVIPTLFYVIPTLFYVIPTLLCNPLSTVRNYCIGCNTTNMFHEHNECFYMIKSDVTIERQLAIMMSGITTRKTCHLERPAKCAAMNTSRMF